jgi:acetyl esterase/lipase
MVAASAAYRLNMGAETGAEDGRSAVRWFKKRAGELGFDPGKLVVGGGSAGGYIACAVATDFGPDEKADDLSVPLTPAGIVGFNPAVGRGLTTRRARPDGTTRPAVDLGGPFAKLRKGAPPAIMFYGTRDRLLEGGRAFCEKSISLGSRNELWTAEGEGHAFFNSAPWKQLTMQKADEFLVSLGLLEGKPTIEIPAGTTAKLEKALTPK